MYLQSRKGSRPWMQRRKSIRKPLSSCQSQHCFAGQNTGRNQRSSEDIPSCLRCHWLKGTDNMQAEDKDILSSPCEARSYNLPVKAIPSRIRPWVPSPHFDHLPASISRFISHHLASSPCSTKLNALTGQLRIIHQEGKVREAIFPKQLKIPLC